ncbi:2-oxo acid dehydrogenase subunit E2 [Escherichia coli]
MKPWKHYPEVNASIDGDDVVYHNYFDVSMAVSTPRGLVTPVLRDAIPSAWRTSRRKSKSWQSKAVTAS